MFGPLRRPHKSNKKAPIVAGIQQGARGSRKGVGHGFDESFVSRPFSSGAYYASSLAVRGALDVDGYVVLACGGLVGSKRTGDDEAARCLRWEQRRAPADGGPFAARLPPRSPAWDGLCGRGTERAHMVDWAFLTHGIQWLRARLPADIDSCESKYSARLEACLTKAGAGAVEHTNGDPAHRTLDAALVSQSTTPAASAAPAPAKAIVAASRRLRVMLFLLRQVNRANIRFRKSFALGTTELASKPNALPARPAPPSAERHGPSASPSVGRAAPHR